VGLLVSAGKDRASGQAGRAVRSAKRLGNVKNDRHAGHAEGKNHQGVKEIAEQFAVVHEFHSMSPGFNVRIDVIGLSDIRAASGVRSSDAF